MKEKELERLLKAVANRRRLAIFKYLKERKEGNVSDIAAYLHLSLKSTSRHLAVLLNADMVERDQRSLNAFYCISEKQNPIIKHIITTV